MAKKEDTKKTKKQQAELDTTATQQTDQQMTAAETVNDAKTVTPVGDVSPAVENGETSDAGNTEPQKGTTDTKEALIEQSNLFSIEELAVRLRVPSWQSVGINRLMGWEAGKFVSEQEYKDAVLALKNKRNH